MPEIMPSIFTRKNYLELWKDDAYISRHTSIVECADAAFAQGEGIYEIRIPSGLYYEINVPRADVSIYNVSADEPAGDDLTVEITGAQAAGGSSAPSANQQSNNVSVDVTGTGAIAAAGSSATQLAEPSPSQAVYYSGNNGTQAFHLSADLGWKRSADR